MLGLKDDETHLVEKIQSYLDSRNLEEGALVRQRFENLNTLGRVISGYPSVRESRMLRGVVRNEQKLLEALCSFATSSHLLHIPSRVVMSRSYLVEKFQFFALIALLIKGNEDFKQPLRRVIFSIIHTLMVEDLYFSCLDDDDFSQEIKIRVADNLIDLWDSGSDPRGAGHMFALESLWNARDKSPPAFGTMDGSSEVLRITIDMEADWREFLVQETSNCETRWALEEFLFGLSHEEIKAVRSRLSQFGIAAVNHDELRTYLGSEPVFAVATGSDFRAIYDFYVDRRDAAYFRKKIDAPGPRRTLEEIYLKYRIARE
ncbi:MAG: hypothetical protein LBF78_11830 [Treponema sp.]|jgi:hypothetical protein|nr:hypothetical protein [Treponema sp.]